jgi:hypothetical protein
MILFIVKDYSLSEGLFIKWRIIHINKFVYRRSLVLNIYSASSPEELVKEFLDLVEQQSSYSYAVLPYIKGLTEPLKRLLKPHDIRMTTKPLYTLEQSFPSVLKTLYFS